jgi:TRAP-type uncharacterized transport system substrate-binding protein
MIDRRTILRSGLAAAAFVMAGGHTPYRQWTVYRRKHLLIGTCRTDAPTYPLGKNIAATLEKYLPESRARVTRAPDQYRLASLITTGQLEIMLFSRNDTTALRDGVPPFEDFGTTDLTAVFSFGDHLLVTRPDFPDRHAWLVAKTLTERAGDFVDAVPAHTTSLPVPAHPAAQAFAAGEPEPAPPPVTPEPDLAADHSH